MKLLATSLLTALVLGCLLPWPSPSQAIPTKPIMISRQFEPTAGVNKAGTLIKLTHVIEPEEGGEGLAIQYKITVEQDETGAFAEGRDRIVSNVRTFVPVSSAHLAPGSPPFAPGPAEVHAQATLTRQNQVVRTWEWSQTVELVPR